MKRKYRKAVFIVVYFKNKYLILHRIHHWKGWEFPKGGIEQGENLTKAVKRELKEETGLTGKIKKYNIYGKYRYSRELEDRKGIKGQSWKLFSAEVSSNKIKIDRREHDKYKWVDFEKAEKMLTWANQRKCLKIVNDKVLKLS